LPFLVTLIRLVNDLFVFIYIYWATAEVPQL